MTRASTALAVLVIAGLSLPLGADDRPACLAAGIEQVNEGAFDGGVAALDTCIASFDASVPAARSLADAYLYKGVALVGQGQEDAAKTSFLKVLEYDPSFEPGADAFPPKVIRVFKAARAGKTKSVINPPNTAVKKAGLGASGFAAIAGGVALVGGGAAAIAAQPAATATRSPSPTGTSTPTPTPTSISTTPSAATATPPCPSGFLPGPDWVIPAANEVVHGTTTLRCAPPQSVPTHCFDGIIYSFWWAQLVGDFRVGHPDTNYAIQLDTTIGAPGTWQALCALWWADGDQSPDHFSSPRTLVVDNPLPTQAPGATPTCPPATFNPVLPAPSWVNPSPGVISDTVTLECALPPLISINCVGQMLYWRAESSASTGGFSIGGSGSNQSFSIQWNTSSVPNGPLSLRCEYLNVHGQSYSANAALSVTVQNPGAPTPTATPSVTPTATTAPTATETPTPTPNGDLALRSRTDTSTSAEPVTVTWTSALSSTGAQGQVWLNGASALVQPSGQQTVSMTSDRDTNTIEGELLEGQGVGAVWTFQLRSGFKPGSLKPQSGNVAQLMPDTIVFRLGGRKGERVAFTFEAAAR